MKWSTDFDANQVFAKRQFNRYATTGNLKMVMEFHNDIGEIQIQTILTSKWSSKIL